MADRNRGILNDTSAVVAHFRRRIDILQLTTPSERLFLSLIALGELYKGAEKSSRPSKNRRQVEDFLQIVVLLYPDAANAETYGRLAVALEAKGQAIPQNDIWIAAFAIELDMPLATLDAHFLCEWTGFQ